MKLTGCLIALLLALSSPLVAQERATPNAHIHTVLAVVSAPPAAPVTGDQYLIGYEPKSPWGGQEGKLARWNGKAWVTKGVESPDLVYDASAAELYAKTDTFGIAHLWPGSKFVRLSESFPKYRPVGPETGDLYIDSRYHGTSITASPVDPATFTLRSRGMTGDIIGTALRIEKYPNSQSSLTVTVDSEGTVCDQDLNVISPIVLQAEVGKQLVLRAGDTATNCDWYAEGYQP